MSCAEHEWSLPVDELGGKRACRRCGHIASGEEARQLFFAAKREERQQLRRYRQVLARRTA